MTAQHHHDTVLPIEKLLANIRACIVDTEATVSHSPSTSRGAERRRCCVSACSQVARALSAEESPLPPPTESRQLPFITPLPPTKPVPLHETSLQSPHNEMDDIDNQGDDDNSDGMDDEGRPMEMNGGEKARLEGVG